MSERIRLDPKAVEAAVMGADSESTAIVAIYKMVYPNWDDIASVGGPDGAWPRCNRETSTRICRLFMDKTNELNRARRYDKQVFPGGAWLNNGFTCHGDVAKDLPDWWVVPAPVKMKEKVTT